MVVWGVANCFDSFLQSRCGNICFHFGLMIYKERHVAVSKYRSGGDQFRSD